MAASAGHVAAAGNEIDPYDKCEYCGQAVRPGSGGVLVTMVGANRECYAR